MTDEKKEREAFEKWYADEYLMPASAFRAIEGTYEKGFVKDAWEAWIARASQSSAPALPVEAIEQAIELMEVRASEMGSDTITAQANMEWAASLRALLPEAK